MKALSGGRRGRAGGRAQGCIAWRAPLAAALVALAAAGCGSSNTTSTSGGSSSTVAAKSSTTRWPSASQEAAKSGVFTDISFCGTKPLTLGIADGFGVNAWSQESYAAVRSEAAKCPNVKQIVTAGGGDLQKSTSDINSLTAQGARAMVVLADFGKAELPAIRAATQNGVKVVPWLLDPGGQEGVDYSSYVRWVPSDMGKEWGQWMVDALHGHGNIVFTGGPAGNPVTAGELKGVVSVLASHPGMKLLTSTTSWPVTNWDPAQAQKQMSALLAKFPKIDGIISDYGTDALAETRAMQVANRPLVPIATLDTNGLSCLYKSVHAKSPAFQLATISNANWMGRIAARKAISAAEGVPNQEPTVIGLPLYEDTLHGKAVHCIAGGAPDFYPSNQLTPAVIAQYGKP